MALIDGVGIELKRNPDFGGGPEVLKVEVLADDAGDGKRFAAKDHGFAEDGRVVIEAVFPDGLADDDDLRCAGRVFLSVEGAAVDDGDAEEGEIFCGDSGDAELLWELRAGPVHDTATEGRYVFEDGRLLGPVGEFCRGRSAEFAFGRFGFVDDDAAGFGERRLAQEDCVDKGDNSGVRAYSEGEGNDGSDDEGCAAFAEHSKGMRDVAAESFLPVTLDARTAVAG